MSVNARAKVSAIIVNWNGAHHLRVCLPSLRAQTHHQLEIVVVDNHSSDDSLEVSRKFGANWLPLGKNMGLGPALNRGAAIASGDWLLFINNDMRFDRGFVAALLEPMASDDRIFATDGMQWNWDGNTREHLATRLSIARAGHRCAELVPGLYFHQQETTANSSVFMGSAACMLVSRAVFDAVGRFDERLPLGYEDAEICWRAWLRGWKTVHVPAAVCWHRVGSSSRSEEGMRMNFRGIVRGRLLLATKLLPVRYALRTWMVTIVALGKDLRPSRWLYARDRVSVLAQTAAMVPALLRDRQQLFAGSCVTPEQQLERLLRLT